MFNKILLTTLFIVSSIYVRSQENRVSISGGYCSTTIKERDTKATGWKITGLYEYNKSESKLLHGLGIGYISVTGSSVYTQSLGPQQDIEIKTDYEVTSLPIYYAPKLLIGNSENLKFFINLMAGIHFSEFLAETTDNAAKASDSGFYGGAGAGFMYNLKDKWFLNGGYEFSYLSNAYYSDGIMHSFNLGFGIKF